MSKLNKTIDLYSKTHSIRRSQAITPFGVGAMVDFADQTLMAASIENWGRYESIHDERLEKILKVDEFRMPISSDEYKKGLPFVRFPEWYFCPSCRRFKHIKEWEKEYKKKHKPRKSTDSNEMYAPRCLECKGHPQLVPARIVLVCEHGHIQDFPWVEWTHYQGKKAICSNPSLKIMTGASSAGLEGIRLKCSCGATTTMKGSFGDQVFRSIIEKLEEQNNCSLADKFRCKGGMPWKNRTEKCPTPNNIRAVQRGASNVYFPKVESSIVIPPYSDELTVKIEESQYFSELMNALQRATKRDKRNEFIQDIDDFIEDISREIDISTSIVERIIHRKLKRDSEDNIEDMLTKNQYKSEEYKALTGLIPINSMNARDFKIKNMNIEEYYINELSKVVLVKKMREVRALTGFTRLNPPDQTVINSENGEIESNNNHIVSIKENYTNWYPAYDVRGEGIFIEFSEEKLNKWAEEDLIKRRVSIINKRYQTMIKKRNYSARVITPKFMLLHTIAHLLIKQLSFECGYSSASLRERIYCNQPNEQFVMSGILIYTASGDSEGTLGGLVRQGYPDTLPKIIFNAIRNARWCSTDPVCIESKGQGRESLNLSACHSCTLLSETSCEEFNILLDRGLVLGTLKNPQIGFFNQFTLY